VDYEKERERKRNYVGTQWPLNKYAAIIERSIIATTRLSS